MEVRVRVRGGDDTAELAGLWNWLRGERELAGAVSAVQARPGATELGGMPGVLAVALGSGGAGVALARSLTAWLSTRRPGVKITVTSPSGSVTVVAQQVKDGDVMPLLHEVLRARDDC